MRKIIFFILFLLITGCSSDNEKVKDITQQIDRELSAIYTSTEFNLSSNPYDYLSSHPEKFDYIVSQKEIALHHFLDKFSNSKDNGLEEYIMATICVEILEEKNTVNEWSSGREWYEKYSNINR